MLKSLPPWGKVLNEVKRMRGKYAAATRERVVLGSLALLSQRVGPLTASPEGEANLSVNQFPPRYCTFAAKKLQ